MVSFLPFEPDHLRHIRLQPAQVDQKRSLLDRPYARELALKGVALTAVAPDVSGLRVLGCAGILHQWPGRALAWAIIGEARPLEWSAIVKRMSLVIGAAERAGLRRLEAQADAAFIPGCRLLEMLSFKREALMRRFSPAGRDCWLYARLAEEEAHG